MKLGTVAIALVAAAGVALPGRVPGTSGPGHRGIGAPGPSQDQRPPSQPVFKVEANLVRVDAYVTAGGVPVEDLTAEDFELLEDGAAQKIETFERVKIAPGARTAAVRDPNSQREGEERAADPRRRVFVIFLDTYHVNPVNSQRAGRALAGFLDQLLTPDDLVGIMKPDMDVTDLMLAHKAQVIQGGLSTTAAWGVGDDYARLDAVEQQYVNCFRDQRVAYEMIARRREKLTFDALRDLVRHLQIIREERKAIIVVSEGWLLFRDNQGLMSATTGAVPGAPQIHVGPGGRLTTRNPGSMGGATAYECDTHRMVLANQDNEQYLRLILDEANRANAAFYPFNAAGLGAPIGIELRGFVAAPWIWQGQRRDSLLTLASATDGLAVDNTNDFTAGLKRIAADLSFYYLLGYYSTNTALDGKFRSIRVRVKRPGVQVRARRGYRAATKEEFAPPPAKSGAATSAAVAPPAALSAALGRLSQIRVDAPFRLHAVAVRVDRGVRIWVEGEIESAMARSAAWSQGAEVTLMAGGAGGEGAVARATIEAGSRGFLATMAVPDPSTGPGQAGAGELQIQARLRMRAGNGGAPAGQVVAVRAGDGTGVFLAADPLFFRLMGGTSAAAPRPAADFRFNRTERVRIELPVAPGVRPLEGRVLDRAGNPLDVPVTITTREDGIRWLVAEVNLAPLYGGDYGLEIAAERAGTRETVVTAIRVVR